MTPSQDLCDRASPWREDVIDGGVSGEGGQRHDVPIGIRLRAEPRLTGGKVAPSAQPAIPERDQPGQDKGRQVHRHLETADQQEQVIGHRRRQHAQKQRHVCGCPRRRPARACRDQRATPALPVPAARSRSRRQGSSRAKNMAGSSRRVWPTALMMPITTAASRTSRDGVDHGHHPRCAPHDPARPEQQCQTARHGDHRKQPQDGGDDLGRAAKSRGQRKDPGTTGDGQKRRADHRLAQRGAQGSPPAMIAKWAAPVRGAAHRNRTAPNAKLP